MHGGDFSSIYQNVLGSTLPASPSQRDKALQEHYFSETLSLFFKTTADNLRANPKTKAELAAQIGIPERMFITRCNPSGTLYEIQICTKFFKKGSSMQYFFVPCTSGRSSCPRNNRLSLPGYH